ncbi:hypothetical protein DFJ73DRAFT_537142 [Zopfochytrium polystomum]|nr:hypothetical protein DFJ73DRAFT_537142 [Zopfochytrium polystomum]
MEVLAATAGHRLTSVTIDYCVDVTMDSLSILWDRCPNLTFIGLAGIMMSPALPHVNNPQAQSSRSQTPALNNPLHLLKTLRLVDCDVTDALLARIAALSPALEFLRIVFEDDRCEGVLRTWEALSDATLMAFASKGTLETVALTWCPKMTAGALAAVLDGNPVSTLDLHKDPQTLVGRVSDDILRALIPRDADDMSFDSAPADSTSVNHLGKIARLHLYGQNALSDDTLRRILSAVSFASTVCVNNTKITEESVMSAINKRERSRHAIYAAEARRKGLPRPEGIPDDITDADIGDGGQPLEVLSLVGCVNIDDEAAARIAKAPGVQRVYYVPPTSAEDSITGTNPGDGGEAAGGDGAEIPVLQDGAEQAWAGADILDPSAVPNGDRLERMDEIAQGGAWYNDTTADEWASEEAQPPRSVEDILDVIMEGVEGEAADRVQHIRRDAATSPPPPLQMDVQEPASIPAVTSAPTPAPFHNLASSSSSSSSSSSHVSSSTLPSTSASSSSRSPRSGPSIAAVPSHSESFPTSQSDSTGAARAVADETQIPAEKATPVALPSNVIQEDRWFVDEGLDIMSLWETSVWKATGRWRFYI